MSDQKERIKHLQLIRKEDEMWMTLRDYEDEMHEFVIDPPVSEPSDRELEMVFLCLKVCTCKVVLEREDWKLKDCAFDDFLEKLRPMLIENECPTPKTFKEVRGEIWGYVVSKLPLLLSMKEDYLDPGEITETIEKSEEKSKMLFACVFAAYMETMLRRIEFVDLED